MKKFDFRALLAQNKDTKRIFDVVAKDNETTIYVYDAIGDYYGVTAMEFVKQLAGVPKNHTLHLRVNSPGGDVFEARAMVTALRDFKGKTVAHIDGLAASAASYLALAADEVEIAEGAFLMIHRAWTMALGNADDLIETAALLEKIDASIVDDYVRRTGGDRGDIEAMMAAETWLTAEDAKDKGFVDSINKGSKVSDECAWKIAAQSAPPEPEPTPAPAPCPDAAIKAEAAAARKRRVELLEVLS